MYSTLLIGALTAVASPQEPEKKVESWDVDPQFAVVQIEIPAIEIPEFTRTNTDRVSRFGNRVSTYQG